MSKIRCALLAVVVAQFASGHVLAAGKWDFNGQGQLTKDKTEAFLDHAVAHFDTLSFQSFSDAEFVRTIMFLSQTGAKFIHCGEASWGRPYPDHAYWDKCRLRLANLHATRGLQDVILEGFIAEHISSNADTTLIPPWLWNEMMHKGLTAGRTPSSNDRGNLHYFHYQNFFDSTWENIDRWGKGASVPDLTKMETQLYFRYLLKEYIDAGFESIWFGQLGLVQGNDGDNRVLNELCTFAKEYAAKHARRHAVLLTSHVAGRAFEGKQLLDYICFPSRVRYTSTYSHGLEINPALGDTDDLLGPLEDSGDVPVLLELDNYDCQATHQSIRRGGFDEITGFAFKAPQQRREFLRQYYHEVRTWPNIWCNRRVHLCMPGRRLTCITNCTGSRPTVGGVPYPQGQYSPYREHCGDEDVIAGLFSQRIRPPAPAKKKPAPEAAPPMAHALHETFDAYQPGVVGGQGKWAELADQRSARVQNEFVNGSGGRSLELAPDSAGGEVQDRLVFPATKDGTCTVSFDVAYKGDPKAHPTNTFMRMDFWNALPDAELRPGGNILRLYWGSPARIVYQGDQSVDVLTSPASGRWYRMTLKFDLEAQTADVLVDGKTVANKIPLRDCQGHGLGAMSVQAWALGSGIRAYLDNLLVEPNANLR